VGARKCVQNRKNTYVYCRSGVLIIIHHEVSDQHLAPLREKIEKVLEREGNERRCGQVELGL
jgi:hypothetical protein